MIKFEDEQVTVTFKGKISGYLLEPDGDVALKGMLRIKTAQGRTYELDHEGSLALRLEDLSFKLAE